MAAVGEATVTASELPVSATVTKYFNIIDPVWQKYPVTEKGEPVRMLLVIHIAQGPLLQL